MKLSGKVALITGGSEGLGYATAVLFLREGAKVVITGRRQKKGLEAVKRLRKRGEISFVRGDVSKAADAKRMVDETIKRHGRLDILFNNAGIYIEKLAEDMTEEEWDSVIDINLKGTFLLTKFAIPHMKRQGGGVIVNNSSDGGLIGNRSCPAYCASKGAITVMTKAMALDYAHDNIRVNSVHPATIDTEMLAREARVSRNQLEYLRVENEKHPIGRIGRPEEVAEAVLFLASGESSFVTGASLSVDGGMTAQ